MKLSRRSKTAGLPPGTVQYVGGPKTAPVQIRFLDYDADQVNEKELASVEDCLPLRDTATVSWINVDGLHEAGLLERLTQHFGIHALVAEDIVHAHQRPKIEDYKDYLYIVIRMLEYDEKRQEIQSEQISIVLGKNYVLSVQEFPGDFFDPVRERIRAGKGRSRSSGPDYLAYMLIDSIVDQYFVALEKISTEIEELEDELLDHPDPKQLQAVHALRREMILVRRSVWPLREVIGAMERAESPLIQPGMRVFLRDVYDHTIQAIETVESFRDILAGLQDLYLSGISHRTNQVMKVLTIISTIFIPLTFLVGVYGMNFDWMPELRWKWGYPLIWGVMVAVAGGMLAAFKRKRWW